MEVVNRLPRPTEPGALARLVDAQQLLCGKFVSEEDCALAQELLEELAAPVASGGFGWLPALLTLASLHETGFEPGIPRDLQRAAGCLLRLLSQEEAPRQVEGSLLGEAASQLCGLLRREDLALAGEERRLLEALAGGAAAGALSEVAPWVRYAAEDLRSAEAEAPAREARRAHQAAREEAEAQRRAAAQEAARAALARAEALRQRGNDACRQGQLPGNAEGRRQLLAAGSLYAEAAEALAACLGEEGAALPPEDTAELRQLRGVLCANRAQVCLELEDWCGACGAAELALQADPRNSKARYRLARARMGLGEWQQAASEIDGSLRRLAEQGGAEAEALRAELWKLAGEVSRELPAWQWSCARPAAQPGEDYEKRLVGTWEYEGGSFQIRLEPWGALIFQEESVKIDLLRKGKLRWRGELELVSGMVLNLSYEPGADVLMTEFVPPSDLPAEQQWRGPHRFTSRRAEVPAGRPPGAAEDREPEPAPPEGPVPSEGPPAPLAPPPAPEPGPGAHAAEAPAEDADVATAGAAAAPAELWLSGDDELGGRYVLLPGKGVAGRPAYRRDEPASSRELYLWHRGGNWGVTAALHPSSLAFPFLARCADTTGGTRHPLELRRPRWFVRGGRGQEEVRADLRVHAGDLAPAEREADGAAAGADFLQGAPPSVQLRGCSGPHSRVNGSYELSGPFWGGRPVYVKSGGGALSVFFDHGSWVIAEEVSAAPRAIARRTGAPGAPHPAAGEGAAWEFLADTPGGYEVDAAVSIRAGTAAEPAEQGGQAEQAGHAGQAEEVAVAGAAPEPQRPAWVLAARAELRGGRVLAEVTVGGGAEVGLECLGLGVSAESLWVELAGQGGFALPLPAAVDADASPVAKWLKRERTLRVQLALRASEGGGT